MRSRKLRKTAGYTIVELMVVVTIIGTGAALTVPGAMSAMAEQKAAEVARRLVRMGKRAQAEASASRRAHVIWFNSQTNDGRVVFGRGRNASCNRQDWAALFGGTCGQGNYVLDVLEADDPDLSFSGWNMRFREVNDALEFALCYTPAGIVWHSDQLGNFQVSTNEIGQTTSQGGGYRLEVQRRIGVTPQGVIRKVIFPLGGMPRIMR